MLWMTNQEVRCVSEVTFCVPQMWEFLYVGVKCFLRTVERQRQHGMCATCGTEAEMRPLPPCPGSPR